MDSNEKVQEEQSVIPNLAQLLAKFPSAPSSEQLESWKQQYGEVLCSGFSETELFVFRPLSWSEHKALQREIATPPKPGEEPLTEADFQERVVATCILWKSVPEVTLKGGTIPTLFEQIFQNSNFMNPQMAAMFCVKL